MPDMESLDRAVEEARESIFKHLRPPRTNESVKLIDDFEAAVSAKARAEERERIFGASDEERLRRLFETTEPWQLNGTSGV